MGSLTFKDWLKKYEFSVTKDWTVDDKKPTLVHGFPKTWGEEDSAVTFTKNTSDITIGIKCALSPDEKLLAVSDDKKLQIYHVQSQSLRQTLRHSGRIEQVFFSPCPPTSFLPAEKINGGYRIVTVSNKGDIGGDILVWDLNTHGRLLDEQEPIDARGLARAALDSIKPELETHEWTDEVVSQLKLLEQFEKVLSEASDRHSEKLATAKFFGNIPAFTKTPFTSDGKLLLFFNIVSQESPQDDTEKISVIDMKSLETKYEVCGYIDKAMWAGFSPNDEYLGACGWDGVLRMYSAKDGSCLWIAVPGGQTWFAAFSPDSKHIIHSGQNGVVVKLYSVADGQLESTILKDLSAWCRNLLWHPKGDTLALEVESGDAFLFDPLAHPPKMLSSYSVKEEASLSFANVTLAWLDNATKLATRSADHTLEIWDPKSNVKWRTVRPRGLSVRFVAGAACWVLRDGRLLSVDGDGRFRYWTL